MPITIARGTKSRILKFPGQFVIQVESPDGAAAAEALDRARAHIVNLDGGPRSAPGLTARDRNDPKYVSRVFPARQGPFIMVDGGSVPDRLLRTIPDIVADQLRRAGISDAVVSAPKGEGGPINPNVTRMVVLRLYPPPPPVQGYQHARGELPDAWLEEIGAWVAAGLGSEEELWASVGSLSIQFPIAPDEGAAFLKNCREARAGSAYLAAGDAGARQRVGYSTLITHEPSVLLAGGGPKATDAELFDLIAALSAIARRLAGGIGYGFVQIVDSLRGCGPTHTAAVLTGRYEMRLRGNQWWPEYPETTWVEAMCDELVLGVFPYQILGPGHVKRLGGPPPGAQPLALGRFELTLGEPASWLLVPLDKPTRWETHRVRDPRVLEAGRDMLSPCLLTRAEATALFDSKRAANVGRPPRGFEYLLRSRDEE